MSDAPSYACPKCDGSGLQCSGCGQSYGKCHCGRKELLHTPCSFCRGKKRFWYPAGYKDTKGKARADWSDAEWLEYYAEKERAKRETESNEPGTASDDLEEPEAC